MIVGNAGVGKTWFNLGICKAVTEGLDMGPWQNGGGMPRKVLIVDGEMEQNELSDRLDRMDIKDNVRVISVPQLYSMYDGNFTLQNERFKDMIINEIKKHNIDIIIFDNLSSLCGNIDENTSKDFHPINSFFVLLRSMGKCVNVVHHNNKSGGQRGTVSHEDNLNTILSLIR